METPTYVVLGKFTQMGIEKIKDSPNRLEAARKVMKSVGGELKEFYYTMGKYDFVTVCQAPNEEAMMKALYIISSKGAVRTETLAAVADDKTAEIIKSLP